MTGAPTPVLVSQRVAVDPATGERRDALDRRWLAFLAACGLAPCPVPNHVDAALRLLERLPEAGLLLTGGNDLAARGGDAPERDATESRLLRAALEEERPVLGVCRGMQLVLEHFGVEQVRVEGHVRPRQEIEVEGTRVEVNSFHAWGCRETHGDLPVWARSSDGVVKAVRHARHSVLGIMWHPERLEPFRPDDLALFRTHLRGVERSGSPSV